MQRALVVLGFVLAATAAVATPPPAGFDHIGMMHAGRLLNGQDQPVTGTHTLTFTIYDAATGGNVLWTATLPVQFADDGTYDVQLGDEAHPLDASALRGGERWLGVAVDQTPELSPRLAFGTVMKSLFALEATNVKGGTVEDATITGGTIDGATVTNTTIQGATISGGTIDQARLTNASIDATSITVAGQPVVTNGGSGTSVTAPSFTSTTTSGPPLTVSSTAVVQNLDADLLGGKPSGAYLTRDDVAGLANLAHNGGFENLMNGQPNWFALEGTVNPSLAGTSIVAGFSGQNALDLADRDGAHAVVVKEIVYPSGNGLAGRTFTASVRFKSTFSAAKGTLCISDHGDDGAEDAIDCAPLSGTTDWQIGSVTHKVSGSPAYLKVTLSPTSSAPAEAAEYQFDEVMLAESPAPMAYVPNVEDALAGMIAMFDSSCPFGWSEDLAMRGRFVRGEPNGDATSLDQGGSDDAVVVAHAHTVTGTTDSAGAHTHAFSGTTGGAGGHSHTFSGTTSTDGAHSHFVESAPHDDWNGTGTSSNGQQYGVWADAGNYNGGNPSGIPYGVYTLSAGAHSHTYSGTTSAVPDHVHTFSGTTASSGAHTHTFTATTETVGVDGKGKNMPAYQEMLFCKKL